MIPASHRDLLTGRADGVLTTLMADGQPRSSLVWVDYDGECACVNTTRERRKGRDMERDPRVSLLVVDPDDTGRFLLLRGRAELVEEGALEQLDRLTRRYTRHPRFYGYVFPLEQASRETRVTCRIHADKVTLDAIHHREGRDEMTVLVAAASKHGATGEIAERIGADLVERGLDAEVKNLEAVHDLRGYDAYVLGSGIYFGNWVKPARRFIDTHAAELAKRPTWLFASGSIIGDPPIGDDPNALRAGLAERLVETTHAREHKLFGGKLDMGELGLAEKLPVRMARGREGDWRDWAAVDDWAATIAHELQPTPG
jgi:menaquinone-dependent protoporphyrinogen oxidase